MSADSPVFQITRDRLINEYEARAKQDPSYNYLAFTRTYKSTKQVTWDIVDFNPPAPGQPVMAHAVARAGQTFLFFDYGDGDEIPVGALRASSNDADTNQSKGKQTNDNETMVIEAISCTHRSSKVQYASSVIGPVGTAVIATDPAVLAAYAGTGVIYDPAALMAPPQVLSPFNLEDALFEALKPMMSIVLQWGKGKRTIPIGTLDSIPEGGAKSLLHASGDPNTQNRYLATEGYRWGKQGSTDSDFVGIVKLEYDVVVPINLVGLGGSADLTAGSAAIQKIRTDVTLRVHGIALTDESEN